MSEGRCADGGLGVLGRGGVSEGRCADGVVFLGVSNGINYRTGCLCINARVSIKWGEIESCRVLILAASL